jgi:SAM-dependent methyltransferase
MLNQSMGVEQVWNGKSAIRTNPDARGHVVTGPYETLPPGRYAVDFMVEASAPIAPDTLVGVVDVVTDYDNRDIRFDYILGSDLGSGKPIRLEFDLEHEAQFVEYRFHVNGAGTLLIADEPQLSRRDTSNPPTATRIPDLDAMNQIDRRILKHLYMDGIRIRIDNGEIRFPQTDFGRAMSWLLRTDQDRTRTARVVAEGLGYHGDDSNSLYRAFVGTEQVLHSPPQTVPFTSTICQQAHFGLDQYRYWARALKEKPCFMRKQWEFIYIAQALFERGMIEPGRRGLVFGVGEEQLPALFASFGVQIVASDQAEQTASSGGWIQTGQHSRDITPLNRRAICTDKMFRELVSFEPVDMNNIPSGLHGQFDFCWSACAFEHLGSLQHGFTFVEESLRTLKPGGIAVHTSEFNLSSNDDTIETEHLSVFRRRDIEEFLQKMTERGYEVAPMDWNHGEGFAERVVDLPPFGRGEPHLRLRVEKYDMTSFGLIIRKPL